MILNFAESIFKI